MSLRSGIRVGRVIGGVVAGLAILVAGVFVVVDQIGLPLWRRIFVAEAAPVVPLRSPLAALPETLGAWMRPVNTLGEPIGDTRFNEEMLECVGTEHVLQRRYEQAGRQVTVVIAYHTGEALAAVPMVPELDWVTMHSASPSLPGDGRTVGSRQVRSGEITRLPSGLTVSVTEARPTWNSGSRLLGACVLLIDGASSASWREFRNASTWWARVEVHAYCADSDPSRSFDTFLTDIDDLMPRVVAELQNNCLPLPVPLPVRAVPTD